jgi:hypothetical protein
MLMDAGSSGRLTRLAAVAALIAPLALTACGSSQPGRLQGGTAGGAATGAVIGVIGGPIGIVVGAGIGAGVGALTSTTTTSKQVDLGSPVWQRGAPKTAAIPSTAAMPPS